MLQLHILINNQLEVFYYSTRVHPLLNELLNKPELQSSSTEKSKSEKSKVFKIVQVY